MSHRVSLRKVADACSVSVATASRGLRGDARISIETRTLLAETAERLGYRRDPLLATLASRRFHSDKQQHGATLLLVSARRDPSTPALFEQNVRKRAETLGYVCKAIDLPEKPNSRQLHEEWYDSGVRGIVFDSIERDHWIQQEPWENMAVVSLSGTIYEYKYHQVLNNLLASVHGLYEQAKIHGYKRIGFAMCQHTPRVPDDDQREAMARLIVARDRVKIPVFVSPFQGPSPSQPPDPEPFIRWYKKWKPDAVISFPAVGGYWLELAGARVPEDVALLTMPVNNEEESGWFEDHESMATHAIEMLDTMIRFSEVGYPKSPTVTLVNGWWKEGNTTPFRNK